MHTTKPISHLPPGARPDHTRAPGTAPGGAAVTPQPPLSTTSPRAHLYPSQASRTHPVWRPGLNVTIARPDGSRLIGVVMGTSLVTDEVLVQVTQCPAPPPEFFPAAWLTERKRPAVLRAHE